VKSLLFAPAAQGDLAAIWRYSAERWGVRQADRYTDDIRDACQALTTGACRGRLADVRPNYLKYAIGMHVIYFRDYADQLKVIRILHGKMDVSRHL